MFQAELSSKIRQDVACLSILQDAYWHQLSNCTIHYLAQSRHKFILFAQEPHSRVLLEGCLLLATAVAFTKDALHLMVPAPQQPLRLKVSDKCLAAFTVHLHAFDAALPALA